MSTATAESASIATAGATTAAPETIAADFATELAGARREVRRDLVRLEQDRVIKRVHGGALAVQPRGHLLDYNWQRERQTDEKQRIGLRAENRFGQPRGLRGLRLGGGAHQLAQPLLRQVLLGVGVEDRTLVRAVTGLDVVLEFHEAGSANGGAPGNRRRRLGAGRPLRGG